MAPNSKPKSGIERLLAGNNIFSHRSHLHEAELLDRLSQGQSPEILWLGCSDSRVPETTVCDSKPGDIFVHRNIANVISPADSSAASVVEYAVTVLGVKHVVVCGHTKCGGAQAGLGDDDLGDVLNGWLAPVRGLRRRHWGELERLESLDERATRLAELNVGQSLEALRKMPAVMKAIKKRGLTLQGAIYDVPLGELRLLDEVAPVVKTPVKERAVGANGLTFGTSLNVLPLLEDTNPNIATVHNR